MVSNLDSDTHCLDNAGVFNGVDRMTISTCLADTDANADQQSVTVAAANGGNIITFTEKDSGKTTRLAAYRSILTADGKVGQSANTGETYFKEIWSLASASANDNPTPANPAPDFDGQTRYVWHETADAEGCLDVQGGNASNGQDVQTWECNQTAAQQWVFEKRAAGDYKDSYRLVSKLGNYCLDNRGDFATSDRMGIWSCVGDTDGAAANQSVTIAASGDG